MGLNYRIIFHLMGLLLLCNGLFMVLATIVSGIYSDGATLNIALAAIVTMLVGVLSMFYSREHKKEVKRREGYIIVTFGWLVMSVSGMLPYLFSDSIPGVTNAFSRPYRAIQLQVHP